MSPKPQQTQHKEKSKMPPQQNTQKTDGKPNTPPPAVEEKKTAERKLPPITEQTPEAAAAEAAAAVAAAAVEAAKVAAAAKPVKPTVPKAELKTGNPLGSGESQFVREGSAVHRVYQYLTLPLEKAMTVEEMAKDLHTHMPTHPFESVLTNVRVEIAVSKRKRGMDIGRDAKGRYNVNIPVTERSKARVLSPEQAAEKATKDAAREVAKKARLEALSKVRADKAAEKTAAAAAKEADAKKTPEQVAAELKAAGLISDAKVS